MFANRLRKNLKAARDWAQRESIDCFRIYDADMPEYAFAIDQYGDGVENRWAVVQEYAPPRTVDVKAARQRRDEALAVIPHELEIAEERIFVRERRQQKQGTQYEKLAREREFEVVREQPYRFFVNFTDYLDTGLFLDHRPTRRLIGELAGGKRFLNLFAYTGSVTVYAACGGAEHTTTVDLSNTYLDWTQANLELNGIAVGPRHRLVRADVRRFLEEDRDVYDLVFLDPPTTSTSKAMDDRFDVVRDHLDVLTAAMARLAPGGELWFSTNARRFVLSSEASQWWDVEDLTDRSLPPDFRRDPPIHRLWRITERKK
jgi:23S rRNA (guanine2445-N2)-methyltransferase / 23S rRNA (guanine2069-N7)-methyltransferase